MFNKKSCQNQYQFDLEQLRLVEEVIELTEQGIITKLSECPEKIKSNLSKWNKCITIGDRSSALLKTVKKYKTDSLESDSEDDKKIRRAEKWAMEKSKSAVSKLAARPKPKLGRVA